MSLQQVHHVLCEAFPLEGRRRLELPPQYSGGATQVEDRGALLVSTVLRRGHAGSIAETRLANNSNLTTHTYYAIIVVINTRGGDGHASDCDFPAQVSQGQARRLAGEGLYGQRVHS